MHSKLHGVSMLLRSQDTCMFAQVREAGKWNCYFCSAVGAILFCASCRPNIVFVSASQTHAAAEDWKEENHGLREYNE